MVIFLSFYDFGGLTPNILDPVDQPRLPIEIAFRTPQIAATAPSTKLPTATTSDVLYVTLVRSIVIPFIRFPRQRGF